MIPKEALKKYFNYDDFRPHQEEIIEEISAGSNILAILPTGAGKSICYQVPAFTSDGCSIVVSPLIALMKDQVDSLNQIEEVAGFINSTMDFREAENVLQKISYGHIKLLYLAPERLDNKFFAEKIKNLNPSYIFIDEAHCISEWGHNFRPSYLKIREFIKFLGIKKVSAFTATATPEVRKDILKQLDIKSPKVFVKGFERENIAINIYEPVNRKQKCVELLREFGTPAIIYAATRKKSEEITEFLVLNGMNAGYYHAGLQAEMRKKIQDDFLQDNLDVIVATNAFGMGIDKKDIRTIIHYNMPGSVESYYQEIGRAGRDGKESNVFLLYNSSDENIHNYFLKNSFPEKDLILKTYDALCNYVQLAVGNRYDKEIPVNYDYIKTATGKNISKGLLHSALRHLENENYLKITNELESADTLRIIHDQDRLKEFIKRTSNSNIKLLLVYLIREYGNEIFKKDVKLSNYFLSGETGLNEDDLDETFTILSNLGIIDFNKAHSGESIKLIEPRIKISELKIDIKTINRAFLKGREKLETMTRFVFSADCRMKFILSYFGEDVPGYKCGICDNCKSVAVVTDSSMEYVKEKIAKFIFNLNSEISESDLVSALKGNTNKLELRKTDGFSSLQNFSKDEIKLALNFLIKEKVIEKTRGNVYSLKKKKPEDFIFDEPVNLTEENWEENLILFNRLREARKAASKKFIQNPSLICSDETLAKISQEKPSTEEQLIQVKGFTNRMFSKVGLEFMDVINTYLLEKREENPVKKSTEIPDSIAETKKLIDQGYSLKDISSLRKLNPAVVSMQIETIIEYYPDTNIEKLMDEKNLNLIRKKVEAGITDLKELKESLPNDLTYPMLRIVLAKYLSSNKQQ